MSAAQKIRIQVEKADAGTRLDQFLAAKIPELSRRRARVVLEIGGVFVDRSRVKVASRKVRTGQTIEVVLGGALDRATKATGADARARDAARLATHTILFEDQEIIVVEKPAGLLTAPTPESDRGNLADVLQRREQQSERIYVVHRLDLDTSGTLVFAKTETANEHLSALFREHDIQRQYVAVVEGQWPEALARIEEDVQGKRAVSHFEVVQCIGERATVLHVQLETGRTHQIRLHCAGADHPVLGDKQHGRVSDLAPPRMALHARLLAFAHPVSGEPMRFESPMPSDLQGWLSALA